MIDERKYSSSSSLLMCTMVREWSLLTAVGCANGGGGEFECKEIEEGQNFLNASLKRGAKFQYTII